MTDHDVQEQGTINGGSEPNQDDVIKTDKSVLAASASTCPGVDAACGSDPGASDTGKIDKGI